jgi:hypothetical protein
LNASGLEQGRDGEAEGYRTCNKFRGTAVVGSGTASQRLFCSPPTQQVPFPITATNTISVNHFMHEEKRERERERERGEVEEGGGALRHCMAGGLGVCPCFEVRKG